MSKNILIISYGPVPTPEFQKIEGGGMRCWGLATGLRDNGHSVTVAIFEEFKQTLSSHEGIYLYNWSLGDAFAQYLNSFDVVIVSYSMGDLSVFVADKLSHHVTLILDCYVPIFIEVSARDSQDKVAELSGYLYEINRFNHVLKRGDFFLCANTPQKHMYAGILGSLGVINPYSYRQQRILTVPFGIDKQEINSKALPNPYLEHAEKDDFILLWFGGLYPWFNFSPLIDAVKELSKKPGFKFYLVGGKNPYNNHPDFVKQYDHVMKEFTRLGLKDKTVFFVDWINFDERISWFKNADAVISINQEGDENEYSWRTRVMDYLWGEIPMLTNGGDPLSDELIAKGGAIKVSLSSNDVVRRVDEMMENPKITQDLHATLSKIRKTYYWDKVTSVISARINSKENLPFVDNLSFQVDNHITSIKPSQNILRKYASKARRYAYKAKEKGVKRSVLFALRVAKSKAKSTVSNRHPHVPQKAVFLSHPIDNTGAPLVLLEIMRDFVPHFSTKHIHLISPATKPHILNDLLRQGYVIHKMALAVGRRFIQADLNIRPDDFVLMNTVSVHENYKSFILWMLDVNKLRHAYWFIHEDGPELFFKNQKEIKFIKHLVHAKKLTILVPSQQTASDYNKFFDTDLVKPITLRVNVPKEYHIKKHASDFDTARFLISGNPLDGRKGQLLFLAALQKFNFTYRDKDPESYRDYSLDLLAIGHDYISQQIRILGDKILGDKIHIHPVLTYDQAITIANKCNITVCTSLNESFALYVAEGMLLGNVLLRNRSSGWQEQIKDGVNGYLFNNDDIDQLVDKIELLLNKKKTTSQQLSIMGGKSLDMASKFIEANYFDQIFEEK